VKLKLTLKKGGEPFFLFFFDKKLGSNAFFTLPPTTTGFSTHPPTMVAVHHSHLTWTLNITAAASRQLLFTSATPHHHVKRIKVARASSNAKQARRAPACPRPCLQAIRRRLPIIR
jgi:hypothetical protein